MPMLFSWGNIWPLWQSMLELPDGERLMAFLDDVYVSTFPD